jgi:hypothetical protein
LASSHPSITQSALLKQISDLPPSPEESPIVSAEEDFVTQMDTEVLEPGPKACEFAHVPNEPDNVCKAGGMNPRKVISHIFGRNKNCTKVFPDEVWVYYCRKHYQRARYRSDSWPFKQCDIVLDTLDRIEAWGGVVNFELTLRKREFHRSETGLETPEGASPSNMSVIDDPRIVDFNRTSGYPTPEPPQTCKGKGKKGPVNPPAPVPEWLRAEVSANKSFDEIRKIIQRLRSYMRKLQQMSQEPMFPDIEILPTFHRDIQASDIRASSSRRSARLQKYPNDASERPRVDKKGAVIKITRATTPAATREKLEDTKFLQLHEETKEREE